MSQLRSRSSSNTVSTTDSETLALLGKSQVLKRRFGFWSIFAFAVCELITWETVLALFSQGLRNGGPAGLIYGYIIAWISTLSVYTVIAELASIAPIASGQYHWVYMLAPQRYKKASSYVIGWLTTLAWVATVATETLFAGTMIQGVMILRYPGYDPKMWQGTLLTWAVILTNVLINVIVPGLLPKFELLAMGLHIAGFFAVMVTLLVTTDHLGSASSVFLTALNEGGWPTQGLSYCVGFLGNVATFVGADASVHMAEEVSNAERNIPRAIVSAMIVNGLIGLAMMLTVLYCLGDVNALLKSESEFPFIDIFNNSLGNLQGAVALTGIVLTLTWICSLGITTTASRMSWSFARDKGLPLGRIISKVDKRTRVPVIAVCVVASLAALLTLIYIGSSTAFNDVISLTITGFYGSYLLPCAFLLYHRLKGNLLPHQSRPRVHDGANNSLEIGLKSKVVESVPEKVDVNGQQVALDDMDCTQNQLVWGPWHIPGLFGTLNNLYACVYMVFVIFWSVWPPETPVSASTMNYSVVVTGGVMILSAVWYFLRARKDYRGPLIDSDVAPIVRRAGSISVS